MGNTNYAIQLPKLTPQKLHRIINTPPMQKDSQIIQHKSRNARVISKLTSNNPFIYLRCGEYELRGTTSEIDASKITPHNQHSTDAKRLTDHPK